MRLSFSSIIFENNIFETETVTEDIIREPKRNNKTDLKTLGIVSKGGIDNIINVYNESSEEEKEYWGSWYQKAKLIVEDLANELDVPFQTMAAIVATLSPGNRWSTNIIAARKLVEKYKFNIDHQSLGAYGKQVEKAKQILQTNNLEYVVGPKVTVFFKSIVSPEQIKNELVLDTHAINIWRGEKKKIKSTNNPTKKEREQMISDYRKASEILGISLQSLQAVTWYVWRYTDKQPKQITDVIGFLRQQSTKKANNN